MRMGYCMRILYMKTDGKEKWSIIAFPARQKNNQKDLEKR